MSHVAFRLSEQRRRPRFIDFAVQWLACRFPLSTLRVSPRDETRMTRGQGDSPFLPCIGLPPTTTCQFVLAHSDPHGTRESIANVQHEIQIVDTHESLKTGSTIGFPACWHQINRTLLILYSYRKSSNRTLLRPDTLRLRPFHQRLNLVLQFRNVIERRVPHLFGNHVELVVYQPDTHAGGLHPRHVWRKGFGFRADALHRLADDQQLAQDPIEHQFARGSPQAASARPCATHSLMSAHMSSTRCNYGRSRSIKPIGLAPARALMARMQLLRRNHNVW